MSQTKDIRDAVERELSYDPLVDDSDISVKNINGDVALTAPCPATPSIWRQPRRRGASPG